MCKLNGPANSSSERAVVFGEAQHLVGVFRDAGDSRAKEPATSSAKKQIAVLLLTPGMLHSAGPFRLHVAMARSLPEYGLPSFRFDLSGIGESLAIGSNRDSLGRAAHEIAQAIDYLQANCNVDRVLCFGLCSGADDAIHAALNDRRIVGVFAMDGCGYRTAKYYWHAFRNKYLPKLLNPKKWRRVLAGSYGHAATEPNTLQLGEDIREFPGREQAEAQLLELMQRGVQMHFHYTGGVSDYYSYADQFQDMFPQVAETRSTSQIAVPTVSFAPESDHVAFLTEHRDALVELVCQKATEFAGRVISTSTSEGAAAEDSHAGAANSSQIEVPSEATSKEAAPPALPPLDLPSSDFSPQQTI